MLLRSKQVAAAMLLASLVALAAGCGGGSKNSTPGTTPSASTPTTSSAATTSSSSGSVPNFASAKNCQDLAGLAAKVATAVTASSGNFANVLQTESNELKALAQAAPSDIRGDFQTFSTAFSGFLQALQKSGYKPGSTTQPTAAQIAALSTAARSFNSPKLKQAERNLTAWAHQNCKGVHVGG
jgi:hypothetical protein